MEIKYLYQILLYKGSAEGGKEIKTQVCTETCSHMLTDAITTIVKWKNVDSPSVHQQENKLYFINNDYTFI